MDSMRVHGAPTSRPPSARPADQRGLGDQLLRRLQGADSQAGRSGGLAPQPGGSFVDEHTVLSQHQRIAMAENSPFAGVDANGRPSDPLRSQRDSLDPGTDAPVARGARPAAHRPELDSGTMDAAFGEAQPPSQAVEPPRTLACPGGTAARSVALRTDLQDLRIAMTELAHSGRQKELLTAQLAALGAAPDDNREALSLLASRRAEICCMVLDLAQCGELAEDAAARSACVAALDPALDEQMSAAQLQQVANKAVGAYQAASDVAACALRVLPRALALLAASGPMLTVTGGGVDPVPVSQYIGGLVDTISNLSWRLPAADSVVTVLHSMPMSPTQAIRVLSKALRACKKAMAGSTPAGVPALLHQLISFAERNDLRSDLAQGVIQLFERQAAAESAAGADAPPHSLDTEGAVLLQLEVAFKHDIQLGQAWLKQLKCREARLTRFVAAAIFLLAGIQRFAVPAADLLKSMVQTAFKSDEQRRCSAWLGSLPVGTQQCGADMQMALLAAVSCPEDSAGAWGDVVQPAIGFAVSLMESSGAKAQELAAAVRAGSFEEAPPAVRLAVLGAEILQAVFEWHFSRRQQILTLAQTKLLGTTADAAMPFVRLLACLVRNQYGLLSAHLDQLRVSVEGFALQAPDVSLALLLALWPMARQDGDIERYFVSMLRKAMYGRDVASRLFAMRGFLFVILEGVKRGSSQKASECSQLSMSQMPSLSAEGSGATLLQELLGCLRRGLSQQAVVREAIYRGLPAVLVADPPAGPSLLQLLLPHWSQFCPPPAADAPPLNLRSCASDQGEHVTVVEPLSCLMASVCHLVSLQQGRASCASTNITTLGLASTPGSPGAPSALTARSAKAQALQRALSRALDPAMLQRSLQSLRQRLRMCQLSDFDWDDDSCFDVSKPEGQVNHVQLSQLLGCIEVAIEDVINAVEGAKTLEAKSAEREIAALCNLHRKLSFLGTNSSPSKGATQVLGKHKAGRPKATGGGSAGSKSAAESLHCDRRPPVFSARCLARLLTAVLNDGLARDMERSNGLSQLRNLWRDARFRLFVVRSTQALLQSCSASTTADAVTIGATGDSPALASAQALMPSPDWHVLGAPLYTLALDLARTQRSEQAPPVENGAKREKDPGEALKLAVLQTLDALLRLPRDRAEMAALLADAREAPPDACTQEEAPNLCEDDDEATVKLLKRLPSLKAVLDALMQDGSLREAEVVAGMLQHVGGMLPPQHAETVSVWLTSAVEQEPGKQQLPGLARALFQGVFALSGADDVIEAQTFANEIKEVLGTCRTPVAAEGLSQAVGRAENYPFITKRTAATVLGAVLARLEAALGGLDWLLARLKLLPGPDKGRSDKAAVAAEALWHTLEEAACERLQKVFVALGYLTCISISGSPEQLLRCLTHAYKLLASLTRINSASKRANQWEPSKAFQQLVHMTNKEVAPTMYGLICDLAKETDTSMQEAPASATGGGGGGRAVKQMKAQGRAVPNLVFQVEDFEAAAFSLGQKCSINLMRGAKRTANRDVKIDLAKAAEEPAEASEAEEEEEGEGEGEEGDGVEATESAQADSGRPPSQGVHSGKRRKS